MIRIQIELTSGYNQVEANNHDVNNFIVEFTGSEELLEINTGIDWRTLYNKYVVTCQRKDKRFYFFTGS